MASPSSPTRPAATLGARIAAYVIDSIVLLVVLLIFFVIGGAVLLFTSDLGDKDPPDAAFSAFIAILIGGPVVFWSLLNLALTRWRAQTAGMYVAGIVATSDEGDVRAPRRVLVRWFGMHPTLYHPLFVPLWALLAAYATSATLSRGVLMVTLATALLCLAVPIVSLVAMALDGERRGIHDRIARTRVVPVDAP